MNKKNRRQYGKKDANNVSNKTEKAINRNDNGKNKEKSYNALTVKHLLEEVTTILIHLDHEKRKSQKGELNQIDWEAYKFFNNEVQDLLELFIPIVLSNKKDIEAQNNFACHYRDFIKLFLPYIIRETNECFPDVEIAEENRIFQLVLDHCAELFTIYNALASHDEIEDLYKVLLEVIDTLSYSNEKQN